MGFLPKGKWLDLDMVRSLVCLLLIMAGIAVDLAAERTSLFGRRGSPDTTDFPEISPPTETKPDSESKVIPPKPKPSTEVGSKESSEGMEPPGDDAAELNDESKPVRIRPIDLVQPGRDRPISETLEFRLSRIDKPLSRETSTLFRQAWEAFRTQHRWVNSRFERLPGLQLSLGVTPLQDLGEGRWLVNAQWSNPGHFTWCPRGPQTSQAIVMFANSTVRPEPQMALPVTLVGRVNLRFNCEIEPAVGQRLTLQRFAFLETPPIPDDDVSRNAFNEAVQAGINLSAVLAVERSCKPCNGLGFIRREIPGKIENARDPCPAKCVNGKRWLAVEIIFRP